MSDEPLKNLKPQEELLIHEAILRRVDMMEKELSFITDCHGGSSQRTKKTQVPGSHPECYGRQVDLLEIYCEPNSQLAQQVNARGGCAIRFSRVDGDLSTTGGLIDKLMDD